MSLDIRVREDRVIRQYKFVPTLPLSERELDVLKGVAAGRTSKEIGSDLNLSFRTVQAYMDLIYVKLKARNAPEAVAKALREGIIE